MCVAKLCRSVCGLTVCGSPARLMLAVWAACGLFYVVAPIRYDVVPSPTTVAFILLGLLSFVCIGLLVLFVFHEVRLRRELHKHPREVDHTDKERRGF